MKKIRPFFYAVNLIILPYVVSTQKQLVFELAKLYENGQLKIINRAIKTVMCESGNYIAISENKKEGLVWLPVEDFRSGTIEVKMRGKDVFQRSFIGIAFHGLNDTTYDAVYCRPFNFLATDPVRRSHAVQYISLPDHTWEKLRKERDAVFENGIANAPKPDSWMTMKLVMDSISVKVYINDATQPSLVVKKLNNRCFGKLGLFTADSSGGDFKSVTIKDQK